MLTVMCPNCRHRFPAPGCCNPGPQGAMVTSSDDRNSVVAASNPVRSIDAFYGGDYLLVPREFNDNNRSCFINAPTIIHGPTIIQQPSIFNKLSDQPISRDNESWIKSFNQRHLSGNPSIMETILDAGNVGDRKSERSNEFTDCHIDTNSHLSGGTVTIRKPSVQAGDCLIRAKASEILVQSPIIEIRPKLSGGECCVQKHVPIDVTSNENPSNYQETNKNESTLPPEQTTSSDHRNFEETSIPPPSGCQELPGIRRFSFASRDHQRGIIDALEKPCKSEFHRCNTIDSMVTRNHHFRRNCQDSKERNFSNNPNEIKKRSTCCCHDGRNDDSVLKNLRTDPPCQTTPGISSAETIDTNKKFNSKDPPPSMEIRVNATLQLPSNVGHCTLNITATTDNSKGIESTRIPSRRDNFNGGGLINLDSSNDTNPPASTIATNINSTAGDRRDDAPTTPLSWLMPCPWGFDNYPMDKDVTKLSEIKRLLQISGWYHEGLRWQQSESLLKNAPIGRWLMRDSSDSRFIFAVSVQTTRGPTSVRVHYVLGRFRLDAEPRLSLAMPLFDCPIKMLQHYVDYSKRIDEHRKEVWVNCNGQLYSQINLTKPLVKEVQTLSHLARIAVNRNKLNIEHLPPLIKNYLAEYPYSL